MITLKGICRLNFAWIFQVLFHAALISNIIDHSKFMDMGFVYKAFMFWHGLDVVGGGGGAAVCLFVCLFFFLFFFFHQNLRLPMPSIGHLHWYNYHGLLGVKINQVPFLPSLVNFIPSVAWLIRLQIPPQGYWTIEFSFSCVFIP